MMWFVVSPDPATVVAGWIPAVVIAVLAVAVVLIFLSMRKAMRRISIPQEGVPTGGPDDRSERHAEKGEDIGTARS